VTGRRLFKYALAVVRDQRLLLCRPHLFPDLIMPGGVRENGEGRIDGLRREIREELGPEADIVEESLRWLGHFEDAAAGKVDTVIEMDVYLGEVSGELIASAEIASLVWFGRDDDPERLSAVVRNGVWPALLERGLV
jgi:ADP-ribose pyrophosphatase YjhB (NUDIX family)